MVVKLKHGVNDADETVGENKESNEDSCCLPTKCRFESHEDIMVLLSTPDDGVRGHARGLVSKALLERLDGTENYRTNKLVGS